MLFSKISYRLDLEENMNLKEDPISKSLITPAKTLFTDALDIGLDEVIKLISQNTEVLQKIPVIKWLFITNDVRSIIQTAFFIRKYASFLGPINEFIADNSEEIRKFDELFNNDKDYQKMVEYSLIELDRYQNEKKAKLLGILFVKTFKEKIFTIAEYNTILFSIENMHPYTGIDYLQKYYDYRIRMESTNNEETKREIWTDGAKFDYSSLATTGFLTLPKGGFIVGDIGGAFLNELGKKFYENVIIPCRESDRSVKLKYKV